MKLRSPVWALLLALTISGFELAAASQPDAERQSDARETSHDDRPNILVIVTDDQRSGLGVMPETRKRIRDQGAHFGNAYATTPACCPSRASIFTGQYAHNHGILTNSMGDEIDSSNTVQRYLSDAGYKTGIFGKFLNSWPIDRDPPYFDQWRVLKSGRKSDRYVNGTWNMQGEVRRVPRYSTDIIEQSALGFLDDADREDERPWFMYLGTNAPHAPFQPAEEDAGAKIRSWRGNPAVDEENRLDKPPYVASSTRSPNFASDIRTRQFRTLLGVDRLVGTVLDDLKKRGEIRNTLIVFMSDNGMVWGEHRLIGKNFPYLQSVGIELAIKWPGKVEPGTSDRRLVANIDIVPTLVDAAGIEDRIDHVMDGRSLLDPSWRRDRLLLENWKIFWASTLTKEYQYVQNFNDDGQSMFEEYYNLERDPWQRTNVLFDRDFLDSPRNLDDIRRQLDADRSCSGKTCP